MNTLVSFVGVGRRNEGENEAYLRTTYALGKKEYETAIFTEALLELRNNDIGKCLLIGTRSSSWGCLLEKDAYEKDQFVELFDRLEKSFSEKYVSDEILDELAQALSTKWKRPVRCHAHEASISEENAMDILMGYLDALIKNQGEDLLIDVTHAFRSMPLLLNGAIQIRDAMQSVPCEIEFVYGEYNPQGASPVRSLKPIWKGAKFAQAYRAFNERFDAEELAHQIKSKWPEGAKAITRIGNIIQANYFTKFDEALAQLNNALQKCPASEFPQITLAKKKLEALYKRLSSPKTLHTRLLALAEMLAERRLWGQAITTLQLSMEAYVFSKYGDDRYGDYDQTKNLLTQFSESLTKHDRDNFHQLRNARNAIAHGGCRSARGGIPQEGNLPSQFKGYLAFLKRTF